MTVPAAAAVNRQPATPGEHGTYAGAVAHQKDGTPICAPCRLAMNTYMRDYRRAGKCAMSSRPPCGATATGLGWPL